MQTQYETLRQWYISGHTDTTTRETMLIKQTYLPLWNLTDHAVVLSHDVLYLYKGIINSIPHDQLLFIYVKRRRSEFVRSFSQYRIMESDYYYFTPMDPGTVSSRVSRRIWSKMSMPEKAGWFYDEVDARWNELRKRHPHLSVLEVQWASGQRGSFGKMAKSISTVLGLKLREQLPDLKHHTPRGNNGTRLYLTAISV